MRAWQEVENYGDKEGPLPMTPPPTPHKPIQLIKGVWRNWLRTLPVELASGGKEYVILEVMVLLDRKALEEMVATQLRLIRSG